MSADTLFGIPAGVMGQNPPPTDIPIPTETTTTQVVETAPTEISAAEEAAANFTQLLPYAKKFAKNMNGGGLARVLNALMEFPLGASQPRFLNDAERQLFFVAQELNGYKSTVLQNIIKNSQMPSTTPVTETESNAVSTTAE